MNSIEVILAGLSRSGNHAIVDWMWAQARGRRVLLNCAEGKTNPFASCRPLADGRPWRSSDPAFDIAAERAGALTAKDWLLHTYEDAFLGHVFSPILAERHDAWVGRSARRVDMLVLRDPFNLIASRDRGGIPTPPALTRRLWKQHAREFLGDRRLLRHDKLPVSYNRWVADTAYRRRIADHLGLRFTDAGRETVAGCHGGSSFDGRTYDGRATAMPVLDRWRTRADDPDFWAAFDDEMVALAERAFGALPAARHLGRLGSDLAPEPLRAAV